LWLNSFMRKTKIVCTIGPASRSREILESMILAGMNVARLNFSHGKREEHGEVIRDLREISQRLERPVAILQDLCGPKIRTGTLKGGAPVQLVPGAEIVVTTEPVDGTASLISTTYSHLPLDVKPGNRILLADGTMELEVVAVEGVAVRCRVVYGGMLGEHKGMNMPGANLSAPALTEKDIADLKFGVKCGVDYIAVSFVRRAEDLRQVRKLLDAEGARTPVIAKIEKPEAVQNLDEILEVCEGVMVARGDLGVEVNPEKVPMLQKKIIETANRHGDLVITATQMLESMIENPRPTRAEASDVANAILDGTDAVMLSGETSVGKYPLECVRMMERIALETEASGLGSPAARHGHLGDAHAIAHAACSITGELDLKAICTFTQSGHTAQLLSKERPKVPVIAFTYERQVFNRAALYWGVTPLLVDFVRGIEELFRSLRMQLMSRKLAERGESVVILAGMPLAAKSGTNTLKIEKI
jgi:pyruvate kinase